MAVNRTFDVSILQKCFELDQYGQLLKHDFVMDGDRIPTPSDLNAFCVNLFFIDDQYESLSAALLQVQALFVTLNVNSLHSIFSQTPNIACSQCHMMHQKCLCWAIFLLLLLVQTIRLHKYCICSIVMHC